MSKEKEEGTLRLPRLASAQNTFIPLIVTYCCSQQCNRQLPCSNCARRYPPVDCIYNNTAYGKRLISPMAGKVLLTQVRQPIDTRTLSLHQRSSLSLESQDSSHTRSGDIPDQGSNYPPKDDASSRPKERPWPPYLEQALKQRQFVTSTKSLEAFSKSSLPTSIGYGMSQLLCDLSVEPTKSNVELFHICRKLLPGTCPVC